MTADTALYNLQQAQSVVNSLQEQVASSAQVNKPSEDPLTARQLLDLQDQISQSGQYTSNISKGTTLLNVASTALSSMSDIMSQVKKISMDNVSGNGTAADRASVASTLDALKQQLVDLGNTQYGDQYVFGGTKNSQPPFSLDKTTGKVTFGGDSGNLNINISQGSKVAVNVKGGEVLSGQGTPPGIDIFGEIDNLKTALTGNPPDTATLVKETNTMGVAGDQIIASQTDLATRLVRLNSASTLITNNQNTLQSAYDSKQSVDMTKVGVELSQEQTAFQAALQATAKLSQLSLLTYMT